MLGHDGINERRGDDITHAPLQSTSTMGAREPRTNDIALGAPGETTPTGPAWGGTINPNEIINIKTLKANDNCAIEKGKYNDVPVIVKRSTKMAPMRREIDFLDRASKGEFIVAYVGWFEEVQIGVIGIVMQKCVMDLKEWSNAASSWPPAELDQKMLQISQAIAKGLAHINKLDIIHNDLKPVNVFMDKFNKPCIGDFGVATKREEKLIGYTKQYFDKESLDLTPDELSDSWLLGATLWEFWSDEAFSVDDDKINFSRIRNPTVKDVVKKLLRPRMARRAVPDQNLLNPELHLLDGYWAALATGNIGTLRSILSAGLVPVNTERDGQTGLQFACRKNLADVVKTLLDFKADHERKDENGMLVIQLSTSVEVWRALATKMPAPRMDLFEAAEKGFDVNARLILVGKDPSTKLSLFPSERTQDSIVSKLSQRRKIDLDRTCTPFHVAAYHGYAAVCRVFLEAGADVNCRDNYDETPFIYAAYRGHVSVVKVLAEKGADFEARGALAEALLHRAVEEGHVDIVRLLLDRGADFDCRNNNKMSPLMVAARPGRLSVAQVLVESGADVHARDMSGKTPLHWAASSHVDIVRFLLDSGAEVDCRDNSKKTPLMKPAFEGNLSVAQVLVERGADVHARTEDGRTPLHLAASKGHVDVVRFLLDRGADVDSRDREEWTPLMVAARWGHLSVAQVLVERGADVHARDEDGRTARDWALELKKTKVAAFLAPLTMATN
ncbi:Serine/threonine-protein kinase plk1 [Phlyctochytrium bullatum]|nr:Serine/threonine-protein kinase plk1 [Phlyctochytrium bullatum]